MITSIQNKRVAKAVRLKKRAMREKDGLFLVEGAQGVGEGLTSPGVVQEVFTDPGSGERLGPVIEAASAAGVPIREVSPEVMGHLTSTVTPQGVVGVARFVDVPLESIDPAGGCVTVLVEVRDPGNAGTVLRSADASDASAVVFTRSSVDVYNPKTVRATAGSLFHVPVVREAGVEETVDALRERGLPVLAAAADGEQLVHEADLASPVAILFGNEAHGLSANVRALADGSIRVPIAGRAESLNLAAAATLVLFECARQRSGGADVMAQVIAGAAHDIRSPLTAVRGFALTLRSRWDRLTEDQRLMMLEGIATDAARMDVVLSHLVDAARLQSGTLRLASEPADLLDAARSVSKEVGTWGQEVEVEVRGEPARALVDRARLRSMLLALVEAAQWWGEEGPVVLEVAAAPTPTIAVRRAVTRLDAEGAAALFRPRSPGTGGGSKVGLHVARGLADAHGGDLAVVAGEGIAFTLLLPPA